MQNVETKDQFINSSLAYLEKLKRASNFDQMLELWRDTSLPYSMDSTDPYSPQYKEEVKSVYKSLTASDYDANNELTSNKQSEEDFEIGFPWISGNLRVCAEELAKPVQILQTLHLSGKSGTRIIEFGCGWGNLALPLARARQNVSVVDIDEGFINRLVRKAEQEGLSIASHCGDFVDVATSLNQRFGVVIFQSSFHHCLDFVALLRAIKSNLLEKDGIIIFASEPISRDVKFPWGLRYDGESLWAIMCNKWLELGFNYDFFSEMLINVGLFFEKVPGISGYVGEAWKASRSEIAIDFDKWALPAAYDETFYPADLGTTGRFCTQQSLLPGLRDSPRKTYELNFINYGTEALRISLSGETKEKTVIPPGSTEIMHVRVGTKPVSITSETFIPNDQCGNGDTRVLGANLQNVRLV